MNHYFYKSRDGDHTLNFGTVFIQQNWCNKVHNDMKQGRGIGCY